MKSKRISLAQAADMVKDNATIMVGGFNGVGGPNEIVDELVRRNVKNITLIANDTAYPDRGLGRMVVNKQIKKFIGTHIGTNPETGRQMTSGEIDVTFIPQGTMAEQLRAAGHGLGGVLTPVGLGTAVAEGKQTLTIDGQEYLLELPIHSDLAFIYGTVVDEVGNAYLEGTTRNFNVAMAKAAKTVVIEAEKVVPVGKINPNYVTIPGIFIDYIMEETTHGQA